MVALDSAGDSIADPRVRAELTRAVPLLAARCEDRVWSRCWPLLVGQACWADVRGVVKACLDSCENVQMICRLGALLLRLDCGQ